MLTYLQKLRDERDSLSATSSGMLEKAAEESRGVSETEKASIERMAQRCAEIDSELKTFSEQYESQRAYAALRQKLSIENEPTPKHEPEKRGTQQIETREVSWGERFTDSDAFKNYPGHGRSGAIDLGPAFETRAPIFTDTPDEGVLRPMRWTGNATQTWAPRLLALVNTVTVSAGAVDWVRYQPHPPSEAQIVAEGELKPEADISLELKSGTLETIAHHKVISRQALEDIPGIQTEVTNRLRAGILVKLQNLLADAIAAETDFPTATAGDLLSAVRIAIAEMDDSNGFTPRGVLLNPADWASIDLAILTGTLNGPQVNNAVFGLRFIASNKVPTGTAYVGDFNSALTLFQRSSTSTFVSDSHDDYFLRNMLAIVAETRALAVVSEPLALVRVTAGSPTPPTEPGG